MSNYQKLHNEQEIVEQAKTDNEAFETIYNHYFPQIYGFIYKRTGNHEITEELVSNTFLKAFKNLKKYQYQGYSFSSWLYRIASNNLVDYYRKASKYHTVNLEKTEELIDNNENPNEDAKKNEHKLIVQTIMQKMNKKYQKILHLKFFAEMNLSEIAETLKLTDGNTRVLVHRALKQFQKLYEQHQEL